MLQNYDMLDKILRYYLGVSLVDIINSTECTIRRMQTTSYFRQELDTALMDILKGNIFVSHIFQVILGYVLTVEELPLEDVRQQLVEYVSGLRQSGGGFLPIRDVDQSEQLFSERPEKTDIYATSYALSILELLERPAPSLVTAEIESWLKSQRAASGWFYQLTLGNTMEERKFQIELTLQTLSALLVFHFYQVLDFRALEPTREVIIQAFPSIKYMGALYQSLYSLSLLQGIESSSEATRIALDFVIRHYDEQSGGFFEYLFEETKIDEIAGQKQRFQHDYLMPTITASYRALQVMLLLKDNAPTRNWWTIHRDKVKSYFTSIPLSSEDGFGSHLQIAKFLTPFGPVTTPLETLMVDCAPALFLALDSAFL